MFISTSKNSNVVKITIAAASIAALAIAPMGLAQQHEHGKGDAAAKEVTGEVVDMMCYIDHNALGEKHGQTCGVNCIKGGGPVGIVSDGKAYLVVGEHKPMNDELAPFCGKTITLKGKMAERGGIAMLENAEVVKK